MRLLIITSLFCFVKNAPPTHTVFDQKQSGDYNIQLHLKDFQIIALLSDEALGNLGDYDYNYDYSDFTVKPANSTAKPTEKPISTTPKPTTEKATKEPEKVAIPSTEKPENVSTEKSQVSTTMKTLETPDKIKVQILQVPISQSMPSSSNDGITNNNQQGEIAHYRKCGNGFTRDKKGKCRRVLRRPFDISRLASTLAAKFRHISSENIASASSNN